MTSTKKIAFQGEPGAYSHLACTEAYPDLEPVPCESFEDAFAAGLGVGVDRDQDGLDRVVVEDGEADDPFIVAAEAAQRRQLQAALALLDEEERSIVRLRFGLDGQSPRTLSDVGAAHGLTRERVRQMEGKAIAKLRHPSCGFDPETFA